METERWLVEGRKTISNIMHTMSPFIYIRLLHHFHFAEAVCGFSDR